MSPASVEANLEVGASTSVPVTVTNTGAEARDVTLRARMTTPAPGRGRLFGLPRSDGRSQALFEFDPATGLKVRTVELPFERTTSELNYCQGALAYDGEAMWLAATDHSFVRLSVEDGSVLSRFQRDEFFGSCGLGGIAVGGGELYTSLFHVALAYDFETEVIRQIPLPQADDVTAIAYGGLRGTLFVGYPVRSGGGIIYELDAVTGDVARSFPVDAVPYSLAYSEARGELYVKLDARFGGPYVRVYDVETWAETSQLDWVPAEGLTADGSQAPLYLHAEPSALTLGAGASAEVALRFDAGRSYESAPEAVVEVRGGGELLASVATALRVTGRPGLALDPASLAFGEVGEGVTVQDTVRVRNTGTATLTADLTTDAALGFAVSPARLELAPEATAAVVVRFTAGAPGAVAGQLRLSTNAPDAPTASVELRATAVAPPQIGVFPESLAVTVEAGASTTRGLVLSSEGGQALEFSIAAEVPAGSAAAGLVTVTPSSGLMDPGVTAAFTATFDATGLVAGSFSGALVFTSNDPATPTLRVPFEWTVTGTPDVEPQAQIAEFGEVYVGGTARRRVTITNVGTADLAATLTPPAGVTASPAALTVGPGETAYVVLVYTPSAAGALDGPLRIASDDPDTPAFDIPLSGSAVAGPVAVVDRPAPLTVSVSPGSTASRVVTLRNDGEAPLQYAIVGRPANAPRPELLTQEFRRPFAVRTDAGTGAELGTVALPTVGIPVAFAASADSLFYLIERENDFMELVRSLLTIDRATGEVTNTREFGRAPYCGLTHSGGSLYLALRSGPYGSVSRLDLATDELGRVAFDDRRGELAPLCGVSVERGTLFLNVTDHTVNEQVTIRVDLATGARFEGAFPTDFKRSLALVDGRLFASREAVAVFDPETGEPTVGLSGPAYQLAGVGPTVGWLGGGTGTVAPGATAEVEVRVGEASLGEGTYEGVLAVLTDDPAARETAFPVTLEVQMGTPVEAAVVPQEVSLGAPYPNPATRAATLSLELPAASAVFVEVFDATGRFVRQVAVGERGAGVHALAIDASGLSAGVYAVRVRAGDEVRVQRLLVVR